MNQNDFAATCARIVAGERTAPPPTVAGLCLNQPAVDSHNLPHAHGFETPGHCDVGWNHVHIGTGSLNDSAGNREFINTPKVKAVRLADLDFFKHSAVGHLAPPQSQIERRQFGFAPDAVAFSAQNPRFDRKFLQGLQGITLELERGSLLINLSRQIWRYNPLARLHRAGLQVLNQAKTDERSEDEGFPVHQ
ncbi:hypothetical protein [Hydrogenophaga sp. PAMC20947]|uniref:hypothetical protein n=1 Tax=Hydrogenophaga sp. PAMC20947 TaxID=2565558 RepID=UPI00144583DF|nr:hypothetical protein [Hydrogenophaga sp. PAMC20947]